MITKLEPTSVVCSVFSNRVPVCAVAPGVKPMRKKNKHYP